MRSSTSRPLSVIVTRKARASSGAGCAQQVAAFLEHVDQPGEGRRRDPLGRGQIAEAHRPALADARTASTAGSASGRPGHACAAGARCRSTATRSRAASMAGSALRRHLGLGQARRGRRGGTAESGGHTCRVRPSGQREAHHRPVRVSLSGTAALAFRLLAHYGLMEELIPQRASAGGDPAAG